MALGKIKADTLEHSTAGSLGTEFFVNGSAKAWINFSMSGQSITDSFGFSSIADVDTGRFNCTMSTALANATYTVASDSTYVSGACNAVCLRDDQLTRTTTAYQMYSSQSNAVTATDCTSVMNQICGDKA